MHLAKIREATQRGRRERVASGKPLTGNRPSYGYRWADQGKSRLELEPVNAGVVRSIFDMALEGAPYAASPPACMSVKSPVLPGARAGHRQ